MVGKPFQPGQSGNPAGRPKSRPFKEAIDRALKSVGDDSDALEAIATALLVKARAGDIAAIKELADRLDGKVAQTISGDDSLDPITVRTIVTGVPRAGRD